MVKKGDTVVVVGTRKGLFTLASRDRRAWKLEGKPAFEGMDVRHAKLDPRDGRSLWAAVNNNHWGPTVQLSRDFGKKWTRHATQPAYPKDAGLAVKAVWHVEPGVDGALYAGVEPAGLFRSDDGGKTWKGVEGLNAMKGRETWMPGGGGLCLHTILPDPRDGNSLVVAISSVGVLETRDGGATWRTRNGNIRADYSPNKYTDEEEWGSCAHKLARDPRSPGTLYMQNHCGVYARAETDAAWTDIGKGLPSRFGFPLAVSADGDVFTVPLVGDYDRVTKDGAMAVYKRKRGAKSWTKLTNGLPQKGAYLNVLREGLATDDDGGVYVGTSTGQVFASRDNGASWKEIASHLPQIESLEVGVAK